MLASWRLYLKFKLSWLAPAGVDNQLLVFEIGFFNSNGLWRLLEIQSLLAAEGWLFQRSFL